MNDRPHAAAADASHPWVRDGHVHHSREDMIAEGLALLALVFSVAIGIVIALLPVSAAEAMARAPSTARAILADDEITPPPPAFVTAPVPEAAPSAASPADAY